MHFKKWNMILNSENECNIQTKQRKASMWLILKLKFRCPQDVAGHKDTCNGILHYSQNQSTDGKKMYHMESGSLIWGCWV